KRGGTCDTPLLTNPTTSTAGAAERLVHTASSVSTNVDASKAVHAAARADRPLLHLVARAAAGARPFRHRHACAELWSRVARNFDVVAFALMPDHVHLRAQVEHDSALRKF